MKRKELNKNKLTLLILVVLLITVLGIIIKISSKMKKHNEVSLTGIKNEVSEKTARTNMSEELQWELMLVNPDNKLPDNYKITLESIDEYRKFDNRAIKYLKNMIDDMRRSQVGAIWVQSSYRSVEEQTNIYNNKIQYYVKLGKQREEAKRLTEELISRPRI